MKMNDTHISMTQLKVMLSDAAAKIEIGAAYRHYRAGDFRVRGLVILEADETVAVRYAKIDDPEVEFVRVLSSWLQTVTFEGKTVIRFTKIG